jgi:hypothetical protein
MIWLTVERGGSISPYTFDWSGTGAYEEVWGSDQGHSIISVEPGETYQVHITDAAGCQQASEPIFIDCGGFQGEAQEPPIPPAGPAPRNTNANAAIQPGSAAGTLGDEVCVPLLVSQLSANSFRCSFGWDPEALELRRVAVKDSLFLNTLIYLNNYA